jgi:hypothetical protein
MVCLDCKSGAQPIPPHFVRAKHPCVARAGPSPLPPPGARRRQRLWYAHAALCGEEEEQTTFSRLHNDLWRAHFERTGPCYRSKPPHMPMPDLELWCAEGLDPLELSTFSAELGSALAAERAKVIDPEGELAGARHTEPRAPKRLGDVVRMPLAEVETPQGVEKFTRAWGAGIPVVVTGLHPYFGQELKLEKLFESHRREKLSFIDSRKQNSDIANLCEYNKMYVELTID